MKLTEMQKLRQILVANELGGHPGLAYRFSDPDGPLRSGYSFGVCQFDLAHNSFAPGILRDCGFDAVEVQSLIRQTCDEPERKRLDAKLLAAAATVDAADAEEIMEILHHTRRAVATAGLRVADGEVLLHLADYHNQYYLSFNGKCIRHFQGFSAPVTSAAVLEFKLHHTAWGQKRPDDVKRRWNNIAKICREESK